MGIQAQLDESLGSLAYVQRTGLWIKTLPHGTPHRLTNERGISFPRFSPSGKWIAFVDGPEEHRQVCLMATDAGGQKRWRASSFSWLPGRDEIAVARDSRVDIFTTEDGWSNPRLTIRDASLPIFSPDALLCAFTRTIHFGLNPDGSPKLRFSLLVQELDRGARPKRLVQTEGENMLYSFSADGKSIIYWHEETLSASLAADGLGLFSIGIQGGKPRSLGVGSLIHKDLVALSPAGDKVAVAEGRGRETWTRKQIVIAEVNVGGRVTPSVHAVSNPSMSALFPAWSPDSTMLAFTAGRDAESLRRKPLIADATDDGTANRRAVNSRRIWIASTSRSEKPKQLTNDSSLHDEMPTWSADGSHILFCRMDLNGAQSIWLMKADGSELREIAGQLSLQLGAFTPFANSWSGSFYGYLPWRDMFDWWREPSALLA